MAAALPRAVVLQVWLPDQHHLRMCQKSQSCALPRPTKAEIVWGPAACAEGARATFWETLPHTNLGPPSPNVTASVSCRESRTLVIFSSVTQPNISESLACVPGTTPSGTGRRSFQSHLCLLTSPKAAGRPGGSPHPTLSSSYPEAARLPQAGSRRAKASRALRVPLSCRHPSSCVSPRSLTCNPYYLDIDSNKQNYRLDGPTGEMNVLI